MKQSCNYTVGQNTFLVTLRTLIGWHFLYEGLAKLANPDWSSAAFLLDSKEPQWDQFQGFRQTDRFLNSRNLPALIAN